MVMHPEGMQSVSFACFIVGTVLSPRFIGAQLTGHNSSFTLLLFSLPLFHSLIAARRGLHFPATNITDCHKIAML